MGADSGWRSLGAAEFYADHDLADFAQEFLRRNPDYRHSYAELIARCGPPGDEPAEDWERFAHDWGLAYPCDPAQSPAAQPALWLPAAAAMAVPVVADAAAPALPLPARAEVVVGRRTCAGHGLVVMIDRVRHRLWLKSGPRGCPLTYAIPVDLAARRRLIAARAFHASCFAAGDSFRSARPCPPTHYQRRRLVLLLALSDAAAAGRSQRDMAFALVFPNHAPRSGADWKTSSERRGTQRLLLEARRMTAHGYRTLLIG